MPLRTDLSATQPDPELIDALRRAIERAKGLIQPCPDCAGTGRAWRAFGYCLRCDGAGEVRMVA